MIRCKGTKRLDKKIIPELRHKRASEFDQIEVEPTSELTRELERIAGTPHLKNIAILKTLGEVDKHTDQMGATCFLYVIKCGKNTVLYEQYDYGYYERKLQQGRLYTFNDHNPHGLRCHPTTQCEFLVFNYSPKIERLPV